MAKPISALDTLPDDAQAQIIAWLQAESRSKVIERIALPPPNGFGIKTHATTLARFYARYMADDRRDEIELAKLLAPKAAASDDPVPAATKTIAAGWAFQIATKPRRNLSSFKALSRWVLKHRELEQREREVHLVEARLAFDREKWEFDMAHQVLLHRAALDEIAEDQSTTDEEKINRARLALFGSAPK